MHHTANVDREDVCDMTLDKASAAEFEVAVDRQVTSEACSKPSVTAM